MNTDKKDRRVRRTRKQLEEALIKLLKTKNIQKISVRELADEADITRATFYQHYRDAYDMLRTMQDEVIENVMKIINETSGTDPKNFFLKMFTYLADETINAEIFFFDAGDGSGFQRIGDSVHKNYMIRWSKGPIGGADKEYEYYRSYTIFGCISVVQKWITNGKKESPELMAEIAASLLPRDRIYLRKRKSV